MPSAFAAARRTSRSAARCRGRCGEARVAVADAAAQRRSGSPMTSVTNDRLTITGVRPGPKSLASKLRPARKRTPKTSKNLSSTELNCASTSCPSLPSTSISAEGSSRSLAADAVTPEMPASDVSRLTASILRCFEAGRVALHDERGRQKLLDRQSWPDDHRDDRRPEDPPHHLHGRWQDRQRQRDLRGQQCRPRLPQTSARTSIAQPEDTRSPPSSGDAKRRHSTRNRGGQHAETR